MISEGRRRTATSIVSRACCLIGVAEASAHQLLRRAACISGCSAEPMIIAPTVHAMVCKVICDPSATCLLCEMLPKFHRLEAVMTAGCQAQTCGQQLHDMLVAQRRV
jgi:hypothetical protein